MSRLSHKHHLLSTAQAAKLLRISEEKLKHLAGEGLLVPHIVNGEEKYTFDQIEDFKLLGVHVKFASATSQTVVQAAQPHQTLPKKDQERKKSRQNHDQDGEIDQNTAIVAGTAIVGLTIVAFVAAVLFDITPMRFSMQKQAEKAVGSVLKLPETAIFKNLDVTSRLRLQGVVLDPKKLETIVSLLEASKGKKDIINSTGVMSVNGITGDIEFTGQNGIVVQGRVLTNTDPGSAQKIFKTIKVNGDHITAGDNEDTLRIEAGDNITFDVDTSDNKFKIHAAGSRWEEVNAGIAYDDGDVGIGTTDPQARLDVSGSLHVSGATKLNGVLYTWPSADGSNSYVLSTNGSGSLSWVAQSGGGGSSAFSALTGSTNTTAAMIVGTGASLNYTGSGTINASSLLGGTWAAPGAIGSGTPNSGSFTTLSASGALDVASTASIASSLIFRNGTALIAATQGNNLTFGNTATGNIVLNPNGNVGIGTTAPGSLLAIQGNSSASFDTTNRVTNGTFTGSSGWSYGTGWAHDGVSNEADHTPGNTAVLEQNVSVVSGGVYEVYYAISNRTAGSITSSLGGTNGATHSNNDSYYEVIKATNTGNLRFTPSSDFDGSIDWVEVYFVTPTAPLVQLLNSSGVSGMEFRADGTLENLFIGKDSGQSIRSGSNNTSLGIKSLVSNTYGDWNTAVGSEALFRNSNGDENVAVGNQALYYNLWGSENTSVGVAALYSNTHGWNNNAFGNSALFGNSTGNYNSAFGAYALAVNTTGSNNTAFGNNAGYYSQTGSGNIFMGNEAGYGTNNYTGSDNNVIIGKDAGRNIGSNQDGNVFLGYQAGYSESGSNKLYIANSSTANPLIYGNFAASALGINTSAGGNAALTVRQANGAGDIFSASSSGTTRFVINNAGNVGIGTTTPAAKLDIKGSSSVAVYGSNKISVTADRDFSSDTGNWTGSPSWKVNIASSGKAVKDAPGANAITLANSALDSAPVSGITYAIGYSWTTTASSSGYIQSNFGSRNGTRVGQKASSSGSSFEMLTTNGTGALTLTPTSGWYGTIDNVAIYQITESSAALRIESSNGDMTPLEFRPGGSNAGSLYIGENAGEYASGLFHNTAVGYDAMQFGDGNQNSAFGAYALRSNQSVDNNAFGYNALTLNTTGYENAAFGSYALELNISGNNNNAFGYGALSSNTAGNYNNAFGRYTLASNTTGDNNSAFGTGALGAVSTGSNNTAVGYYAGDNLTTGSNNIILGNNIDFASATDSNQLNIGNIIYGVNIDGTGSTLSSGNIGIGTTTPRATLNIAGTSATAPGASISATSTFAALLVDQRNNNGDLFTASSSGTTRFVIRNDGNVGIGVVNPEASLHVKDSTYLPPDPGSTRILRSFEMTTLTNTVWERTWALRDSGSNDWGTVRYYNGYSVDSSYGTPTSSRAWWQRMPGSNLQAWGDQGNTYMTLLSGNLGIGTTDPTSLLDIAGATGASTSGILTFRGTTDPSINFLNGDNLTFRSSAGGDAGLTTRMTILNNGNVGIGTTNPNYPLHIHDTSYGALRLSNNSTGSGDSDGFEMGIDSTAVYFWNYENTAMQFATNNVERMTILGNGNVGIGTTTPGSLFNLSNSGRTAYGKSLAIIDQYEAQDIFTASASGTTRFVINNSGNVGIGTSNPDSKLTISGSQLGSLASSANTMNSAVVNVVGFYGTAIGNHSTGTTTTINGIEGDGLNTGDGNVTELIGVTGYASQSGTGTVTNMAAFWAWRNGRTAGTVTNNYGVFIEDQTGVGTNNYQLYSPGTAHSYFAGNIGIGTTTPAGKLQIAGSTTAAQGQALVQINQTGSADIFTASASGTTRFVINNSGNVGIGISNPTIKLDVQETNTSTAGTAIYLSNHQMTVSPTGDHLAGAKRIALDGYISAPADNTRSLGWLIGTENAAENIGTGSIEKLWGSSNWAASYQGGAIASLSAMVAGTQVDTGSVITQAGLDIINTAGGGTITNLVGIDLRDNYVGSATVTNRYGLRIGSFTGNAANDYGIYQAGSSQKNYFAGNVGIGTTTPMGKMNVSGDTGGQALVQINQTGTGINNHILTASTSGQTRLTIANEGSIYQKIATGAAREVGTIKDGVGATRLDGADSVKVIGKYAYVTAATDNALSVIDISNTASPVELGTIVDGAGATRLNVARGIDVVGKYAYVVSYGDGLSIIDISNPTNPIEVGSSVLSFGSGAPWDIQVVGKYAYIASRANNLGIVDVSNPTAPVVVGSIKHGTGATNLDDPVGLYISGRYAYVTSQVSGSLTIIDISNPNNPVQVGTIVDGVGATNLAGANKVVVSGKYAYVISSSDDALTVIDISTPASPTQVATVTDNINGGTATELFVPEDIKLIGKYVVVSARGDDAISFFDISTPTNIVEVATLKKNAGATQLDGANGIDIAGKYIYVASGDDDSLSVIELPGVDASSANIGSLLAGTLSVTDNGNVANNLSVGNALNVGSGGIRSEGEIVSGGDLTIGAETASKSAEPQKISQGFAGQIASGGTGMIASVTASTVFNGSLYVGTGRGSTSPAGGAEVYRYNQSDGTWTKVTQTTAGTIAASGTSNIASVSAMAVWNGNLYAGTSKTDQAEVYRYDGGTTWTRVSSGTAGTITATGTSAIDGVTSMAVYQGMLYIGTEKFTAGANPVGAGEVYRYIGGNTWTAELSGAGTLGGATSGVVGITAMTVYRNALVVGTKRSPSTTIGPNVFKYNGQNSTVTATPWTIISNGGDFCGSFNATEVTALTVYNGSLYAGVKSSTGATTGSAVCRYNDRGDIATSATPNDVWTSLTQSGGQIRPGGTSSIVGVTAMNVYNGRLYIGTEKKDQAEIYQLIDYGGTVNWSVLNTTAGKLSADGVTAIDKVTTLIEYNDRLIIGTSEDDPTGRSGAEVYAYENRSNQSNSLLFRAAGGLSELGANVGEISFMASGSAVHGFQNTGSFIFSNGITTATGAYDVAEDYPTRDDTLMPGELVAIDDNEAGFVTKADKTRNRNLMGVYSENPGFRLSQKDSHIDGARAVPIALVGRVAVKVSTENGPIKAGDPLTISSKAGVAMKATQPGMVIGRAMGTLSCASTETCEGRVMTYINVSYYDPTIQITEGGNLSVSVKDDIQNSEDAVSQVAAGRKTYGVINEKGEELTRVGAYSEVIAGSIKAGKIDVTELFVNGKKITDVVMPDASGSAVLGAKVEELQGKVSRLEELTARAASDAAFLQTIMTSPLGVGSQSAGLSETLSGLTVDEDLMVLGRTTLSDLGVTGSITAGILSIHGLEGEINTIGAPLKLQPLGLEDIQIMGSKVTIDTAGHITTQGTVTAKEVKTEKVTIIDGEGTAKSVGVVTLPAGSISIDIDSSALTEESHIFVTPERGASIGAFRKDSNTFTITATQAPSTDLKVHWWIVN
jgi:hypothetical protein